MTTTTDGPPPATGDKLENSGGALHKEIDTRSNSASAQPSSLAQNSPVQEKPASVQDAQQPSGPSEPPRRSKAQVAFIMSALCMSVFLAAVDVTIIATALPTISEHFHSTSGYTWIGSAYLLAASASTPLWGKVSDVFGRKPVLLLANAIFFFGSLIAGLSVSIGMLIAGRAVQGIGGGGLVTLVNICIGDLFPLRSRGAYYGMIGVVWSVASALGPVVGGAFTQKVSWRWCFYINLPLDGAAFLITFFFLDVKTPRTPIWEGLKAIDWIGALGVVGGTLMLLFGLQFGGVQHPWNSAIVLCLILFGIFTLALFLVNEWKFAIYPVMPLRLFKKRSSVAALSASFAHGLVFVSASYFLPLYFQAVLGASPLLSGVYLLPTALSVSFASAATGAIIRKTGQYLPLIWAGLFLMTLGFGLFINFDAHSSWTKLIIYQLIAGVGTGPNFQAPLIALQSSVSPRDIATATATFGFIRNLATSISVVLGGVIFQNQMQSHSSELIAALGPQTARALGGNNAGANVDLVKSLPPVQREVARSTFAASLSRMWIMYTCFAAAGLVASFFISKNTLTRQHQETKTGLEGERERRREAEEEKRLKKQSKDVEAGNASPAATSASASKEAVTKE